MFSPPRFSVPLVEGRHGEDLATLSGHHRVLPPAPVGQEGQECDHSEGRKHSDHNASHCSSRQPLPAIPGDTGACLRHTPMLTCRNGDVGILGSSLKFRLVISNLPLEVRNGRILGLTGD